MNCFQYLTLASSKKIALKYSDIKNISSFHIERLLKLISLLFSMIKNQFFTVNLIIQNTMADFKSFIVAKIPSKTFGPITISTHNRFTWELSKMGKKMVMEYWSQLMFISKVIFKIIIKKEKGSLFCRMEICTKETLVTMFFMDQVCILGQMDKNMMDFSKKASNKVLESKISSMEIVTKDFIRTIKKRERENTPGEMGLSTKEILSMTSSNFHFK